MSIAKTKICSACKEDKPLIEFSLVKRTTMTGVKRVFLAYCKPCANEKNKRRYRRIRNNEGPKL